MGVKPYDDYEPPWWYSIVGTAKYYGIHPEEVMSRSSFWIRATAAYAEAETEAAKVQHQRSR